MEIEKILNFFLSGKSIIVLKKNLKMKKMYFMIKDNLLYFFKTTNSIVKKKYIIYFNNILSISKNCSSSYWLYKLFRKTPSQNICLSITYKTSEDEIRTITLVYPDERQRDYFLNNFKLLINMFKKIK